MEQVSDIKDKKMKVDVNFRVMPANYMVNDKKKIILSGGRSYHPDYWMFRVNLGSNSIVAFEKHFVMGVGFYKEKAPDKNLPATYLADVIYDFIKGNNTTGIEEKKCVKAILLLQQKIDERMSKNIGYLEKMLKIYQLRQHQFVNKYNIGHGSLVTVRKRKVTGFNKNIIKWSDEYSVTDGKQIFVKSVEIIGIQGTNNLLYPYYYLKSSK